MAAYRSVPNHIVKQYGSAHAFKAHKRALVKQMRTLLNDLALGCAFFPDGGANVSRMQYELKVLAAELSVKSWGR